MQPVGSGTAQLYEIYCPPLENCYAVARRPGLRRELPGRHADIVPYPCAVPVDHLRIPVGVGAVHVERHGRDGPALVLLHGFGTCTFLWRAIAPALAARGFVVAAIDLLGFGESDRPADVSYTPLAQARYVGEAMAALRLPPCTVVGQDLGALVALLLAAQAPSRVRRLALLEPLRPDELPGPAIRALQRTSVASALTARTLFGARPFLEPYLQQAVGSRAAMPERLVLRYLAPWIGTAGAAELLQMAAAVSRPDEYGPPAADLSAMSTEVLLWCGGDTPPRSPADAPSRIAGWRQLLPRARIAPLVTTRPPGMLVAEDTPQALTAALAAWRA